jgi:hypothetical protein
MSKRPLQMQSLILAPLRLLSHMINNRTFPQGRILEENHHRAMR